MAAPVDGQKIRTDREAKCWTQEDLEQQTERISEKGGVSVRTIQRAEKGKISLCSLRLIACALGFEPSRYQLQASRPTSRRLSAMSGNANYHVNTWRYSSNTHRARADLQYNDLFHIGDLLIPYVRLHGSRDRSNSAHADKEINIETDRTHYKFPSKLAKLSTPKISHDGNKVRLANYEIKQTNGQGRTRVDLYFTGKAVKYSDACKVARHIDGPCPGAPGHSLRDQYAPADTLKKNYLPEKLPNVCGVGLFLIAAGKSGRPKQVIITHQAPTQNFSAGLWSYSASGSMDWVKGKRPNPFADAARETREEINYRVNRRKMRLIGLGVDSKELYVQFSFCEETTRDANDLIYEAYDAKHEFEWDDIMAIDLTPTAIVNAISLGAWEPAAVAALLTIASKEFSPLKVDQQIAKKFSLGNSPGPIKAKPTRQAKPRNQPKEKAKSKKAGGKKKR
jgi:transcriptional regulator with XRE-family HTH domain